MTAIHPRPVVLVIRDGWGANPYPQWNHANAVHLAHPPVDQALMSNYPHVQICTHGPKVGLPDGVMGNSEVGHQNLGAGRIVNQEIMRITRLIRDGTFFKNPILHQTFQHAIQSGGNVHIMGLCSDAGVHSSIEHLVGLLEFARRIDFDGKRIYLHVFADGRDTPPFSGIDIIAQIQAKMIELGVGRVASVIGRYYAMDRDSRWDRVQLAYDLLTAAKGRRVNSATDAFQQYYDNPTDDSREGDEFITPTLVTPHNAAEPTVIKNGDGVIFFNFRGDRPRELVKAFCYDEFPYQADSSQDGSSVTHGFDRGPKLDLFFATITSYEEGLPVRVIIPKPDKLINIFGQLISDRGLKQLRCAETEKYPHVTYFFNDYREEPFPGEDRILVPSPRDVPTYDQKPEMSAREVTDQVVQAIQSHEYDVIIVNFANGDMVGHTGNLQAAIHAVETVDVGVGRIVDATLGAGGALIVTADHGNCEQMIDPQTNQPHTAHTTYDVELIVVGQAWRNRKLRTGGALADVGPTLLEMMDLPQPAEMTGRSLFER